MIGHTISHYKITEKLGEGGMGVVYKAEDTKLRRTVALKFPRVDAIEDAEAKERFLGEAQAAAGLDHPNICTVYEIDEVDGETFLAMAYVDGRTVKEKIGDRPLKLDEAIDIAVQTAEGLKAAHQRGVVHRDVKPANLTLTEEGQVKIMDFGLALLAEQSRLTKTSTTLGTPAYMSPEQAERRPTDRRTDTWSLGVVIYEMVTGRPPFAGERQEAVLYAISNQEPEPVTALRAGLPMELKFIVGKALAKDAADRYQHVEEMIVDPRGLARRAETARAGLASVGRTTGQSRAGAESAAISRSAEGTPGKSALRRQALPWRATAPVPDEFARRHGVSLRRAYGQSRAPSGNVFVRDRGVELAGRGGPGRLGAVSTQRSLAVRSVGASFRGRVRLRTTRNRFFSEFTTGRGLPGRGFRTAVPELLGWRIACLYPEQEI